MDKILQAIEEYKQGVPVTELCKKYQIPTCSFYQQAKSLNVQLRNKSSSGDLNSTEEEAINAYKRGESICSLLRNYKISSARFYKLLKIRNIAYRNSHLKEDSASNVLALHKTGDYPGLIAEKTNISINLVRSILAENGIKPNRKPRGRKEDPRKKEMIDLYISGKTYEEIGKQYDISRQRIQQILAGLVTARSTKHYKREVKDRTADLRKEISAQILAEVNQGKSKQGICKEYKISLYLLDRILYEGGIINMNNKFPIEKAIELRKSGLSYHQISQELNISAMTIYRHLSKFDIGNKINLDLTDENKANLQKDFANGATIQQLRKKYSVSTRLVIKSIINSEIAIKIAEEYDQGLSIQQLSTKYKISSWTIDRILRKKTTKRSKQRFPIDKAIILRQQGADIDQISQQLGFSKNTVRRYYVMLK